MLSINSGNEVYQWAGGLKECTVDEAGSSQSQAGGDDAFQVGTGGAGPRGNVEQVWEGA